jgi:hypothetical protein
VAHDSLIPDISLSSQLSSCGLYTRHASSPLANPRKGRVGTALPALGALFRPSLSRGGEEMPPPSLTQYPAPFILPCPGVWEGQDTTLPRAWAEQESPITFHLVLIMGPA